VDDGNDQLVTIPDEADEQTSVVVVPGVKSTKDEESIFITTSVANKLNRKLPFVYLSPSLDRDGGAQFTYHSGSKLNPEAILTPCYFMRETRPEQISSTSRKKHLTGYQTSCCILS
jgi:hypothetical protein